MSVINQMLRDLDRQQARPLSLDGRALPAVPEAGGRGWTLAALALLAGGIALAFWLRPSAPERTGAAPAPVLASKREPQPKPVQGLDRARPVRTAYETQVSYLPPPSPPGQGREQESPEPAPEWHKAAATPAAPRETPARRALGLLAAGRAVDAETLLAAALAAQPDDQATRVLLARALHAQGRAAEALARLAEREASPGERDYHALRAALEQRLGRHAEAAARYGRLTAAWPGEASYWLGLGLALDGLHQARAARAAYASALSLNSLSEPARAHAAARLAAGD